MGLITWIPNEDQGDESWLVIVRVEDSLGSFDEQSFRIGLMFLYQTRAQNYDDGSERASAGVLYVVDLDALMRMTTR